MSGVNVTANAQMVSVHGMFASSALATLRMRKEVELWELCHSLMPKIPRAYSKVIKTEWNLLKIAILRAVFPRQSKYKNILFKNPLRKVDCVPF